MSDLESQEDEETTTEINSSGPAPEEAGTYVNTASKEHLDWVNTVLDSLPDNHVIALDDETTGLYVLEDKVVGFSISWDEGAAAYIPILHTDKDTWGFGAAEIVQLLEKLKRFRLVYHKSYFDTAALYSNFGVMLPIWDDTYLLAVLLEQPVSLDQAMQSVFGFRKPVDFKTLMKDKFGKSWKKEGKTAADFSSEEIAQYCCRDADFTRRLYFTLKPAIAANKMQAIHKLEVNVLEPSREMNLRGIPASAEIATTLEKLIIRHNELRLKQLREMGDSPTWNPNSPKQNAEVLFGKLQLPVVKRTKVSKTGKGGAPSADKEVLAELEHMHPIIPIFRDWREYYDLVSDLLSKIPSSRDTNGRIHSEFGSYKTNTGRYNSSGAKNSKQETRGGNLQNITHKSATFRETVSVVMQEGLPIPTTHSDEVGEFYDYTEMRKQGYFKEGATGPTQDLMINFDVAGREIFEAPEGWTFLKGDLSQIEYRVAANLAAEDYLIDRFKEGHDFHTITAALFLNIPINEVTREIRKKGKTVAFAIQFGGGPKKLSKVLGISEAEAKERLGMYWARLPKLHAFSDWVRNQVLTKKCISSFFGRKLTLRIDGMSGGHIEHEIRRAMSQRVQGTAAEIMKIGMLRVLYGLREYIELGVVELVATVHDELDFLVRKDYVDVIAAIIRRGMEVPVPPEWAPVVAEVSHGPSWAEKDQEKIKFTNYTPEPWDPEKKWMGVLPPDMVAHAEV